MQARHYGLILGCLAYFSHISEAGPTSRRLVREVYPEIEPENEANQSQVCIVGDVVYNVEEIVPAEQPCLKCKCQPPSVTCEATRCGNKKPGCKAVHRPNQCCPDYECECEYKGRKYSNGERLQASPGEECKVCYCRGGEIQCTDVSCYVRNDCEGKQVPGQCCPKYDHCPTRDSLMNSTNSITETVALTSKEPELNNGIQDLSVHNPKITIQEIIPDVKEIPMTQNPKFGGTEGSLYIEDKTNDLIVTDSEAESSEIAEVVQNAPPIIKIGNDLVFLKKNNVSNVSESYITLTGVEGLQKGDYEEVSESSTNAEVEEKNDLTSAGSSHILSLVKKKKKPSVTTTVPTTFSVEFSSSTEVVSSTTELVVPTTNMTDVVEMMVPKNTTDTPDEKVMEVEMEQNPAYPTLPDIINSYSDENWMKIETENDTNTNKKSKILQEILEVRNNKTVPTNTTHGAWLKSGKSDDNFVPFINLRAALPLDILNAPAENDQLEDLDEENATTIPIEDEKLLNSSIDKNSTELSDRSVETIESLGEYSGEKTTPLSRITSVHNSEENASVEDLKEESEVNDMLFVKEYTIDLSNDEESNRTRNAQNSDVEMINVSDLEKNVTVPEKLTTSRNIGKRENKAESEDDAVFAQLNQELGLGSTEKPKTAEEEEIEARKIFQELLEETSTPKSRTNGTKESEALEKVSQALAKLVLKGSQPFDAGVLRVLGEFFSSQYRSYESKAP